jgi:hypothetical protein
MFLLTKILINVYGRDAYEISGFVTTAANLVHLLLK